MNKYEKYKKVDSSWINNIPSSWRISKVNSIFEERREKVSDKEYEPLSVTKMGVLRQLENVAKTNSGDNRKKVLKNDFVINSRSDRKGSSGLSEYNGSVSLINIVLMIKSEYPKYLHYLLKSVLFQEEFYRNGKGIVADLWSTNYQNMKNISLPIPSFSEQQQIAKYLDWKIGEIDKLIELEKQKIDELKVLKQQFIDNIIESLAYDYIPFKAIFDLGKGLSITKDNLGLTGVKCINYGEIHGDFKFSFYSSDNRLKKLEKITGVTISTYANLEYGNFIFADTSEDIDGCGNFTYLEDSIEKVFAGYHTIVGKLKLPLNCRYLAYYFESEKWRKQVRQKVKGVKVFSITQAILKSTKIQLPNHTIQNNIVNVLDNYMNENNKLNNCIDKKINNLIKLKQSLISEVVTGQIDVRNVKIPERK